MISLFGELLQEQRDRLHAERRGQVNEGMPLSEWSGWLLDALGGALTDAGVRVNSRTAFEVATFLTCVDLIAGKIASLPLNVYERGYWNGRPVRRLAPDHQTYTLLHEEPNDEMTAQMMWKAFFIHVLAWGAGFIEIQWAQRGGVANLWPRNPDAVSLRRLTTDLRLDPEPWRPFPEFLPAGTLVAETTDGAGVSDKAPDHARRVVPLTSMVHVPAIPFDGRVGHAVVDLCKRTFGLALALEKFGSKYFANFAKPGGLLQLPPMSQQDKDKARESVLAMMSGENAQRTLTLPVGAQWTSITNNPQEAQALDTRALVRAEICSVFHVAPRYAGDMTKNSRATNEQDNLELLEYAMRPHMTALCQELKRKLFPGVVVNGVRKSSNYFAAFDEWPMIRPDAASREKFYASGKQWGNLNTNDCREYEGRNPIQEPWAEEYWMPVNMTLSTTPIDPRRDPLLPDRPLPDPLGEPASTQKTEEDVEE